MYCSDIVRDMVRLTHHYPASSINPVIKMIIMSDIFFWSAWYTVLPILSIFIVQEVPGASVETAAFGFSFYLLARVAASIVGSKFCAHARDSRKVFMIIYAILILNIAYVLMAFTRSIFSIYMFYTIIGMGIGLASPIRSALFSTHLDKNKETFEWALLDSVILIGIAICSIVSGVIIRDYGYTTLFLLATFFNFLSIFPYFAYKHMHRI